MTFIVVCSWELVLIPAKWICSSKVYCFLFVFFVAFFHMYVWSNVLLLFMNASIVVLCFILEFDGQCLLEK